MSRSIWVIADVRVSLMAEDVLDTDDFRLIAALQLDPRASAEKLAAALSLDARRVRRRLAALLGTGIVSIAVTPPRGSLQGVMLLRIRVLRGKIDVITSALARRDDIPFIDVSAGGDEISAVLVADPTVRDRLVFRQLPATSAVTSVDAQTVMHVFSDSSDWRLDCLTADEVARLGRSAGAAVCEPVAGDELDAELAAVLEREPRASAAAIAQSLGRPESTVRRRLHDLLDRGGVMLQVFVDPRRLGLTVDAAVSMKVPPAALDAAGRALAAHPAVHGALATTGAHNLYAALWLQDLERLYEFITRTLAELNVDSVDTMLIGQAVKRPGRGGF
jgi:DNA-binding Lrp family transcriptional regulator